MNAKQPSMARVYVELEDAKLAALLEASKQQDRTVEELLRQAAGEWLAANRWRL